MHEKIQEAFSTFREMMDDFENWYPYNENDPEEDKQDAFISFARAKLNLELGEYSADCQPKRTPVPYSADS